MAARLLPVGEGSLENGREQDLVLRSRRFLDTTRKASAAKSGRFQLVGPDRLHVVFRVSGRVGETEVIAVEVARRIIYDIRRGNAEQGPKLDVKIGIDGGRLAFAPIRNLDGLSELIFGPAVTSAERLCGLGQADAITVSETTFQRVSFIYRGRRLETAPPGEKIYELVL